MLKDSTLRIQVPRWATPLLNDSVRYLGAYGGRASGKSHFFAENLIRRICQKRTRALGIREIQKSIGESVKKLLEIKIENMGLGSYFDVQQSKILHKNGSEILFQGMQNHTADSIKSFEDCDIAWCEEAQRLSQHSLDLLRPTIRKPGSQLWFSWNPALPTDPVEFLRDSPPPNTIVVPVNYTENPWLPDTLLPEIEYDRRRDIDKFNHIWLGQYLQNSEARVFKNWTVQEFESPENTLFRFGADWGFANDPTVLVRMWLDGRKLFIDYEAYQIGCEIVNIPLLFATIPESHRFPIVADGSRPETISHVKKNGFPKIYGASKGKGSVEDGVEWLKSYDIVVHPRCIHTIDELTTYSYVVDEHASDALGRAVITSKIKDEKNHLIDSIRYACEAVRKVQESDDRQKVVAAPPASKNYW